MNYKEITVPTQVVFSKKHQEMMSSFLNQFDNHIYFEPTTDREIKIFVNSVDIQKLKQTAIEFKNKETHKDTAELLDSFVEAVENIGSYGLKGRKRVFVDFNAERKVKNRKQKGLKRTNARFQTQQTQQDNALPKQYENKIICGDSLETLKQMPDNCVDVMLTSPPYNFGLEYAQGQDDKKWEEYFSQLFAILKETNRVLKHGGRMIVNVQPLFSDYIPTHHIISKYLLDIGMLWKGEIIWEKNNYNCKYTAWGSWKSPSSPYLKYTWEFIEVFCKNDLKHTGNKQDIDINEEEFKKWVIAKWSIAPERNMKQFGHPAMFPEKLVERCLKLFSFKNDVILDVFNGVGTTTAVAKHLNRRYIGIDISQEYCNKAEKRIESTLF